MIDADGSPFAYAPADSGLPALDYLGNAGHPGRWYGIACDKKGVPYVQTVGDPAPGYYVSTTALMDISKKINDPSRYVDSQKVPYVVIPSIPAFDIGLGDVGMSLNLSNGASSEFVVGDIGPRNKFGEGSIKLAQNLDLDISAKTGGTDADEILYIFFVNSRIMWPATNDDILNLVSRKWIDSGIEKLKFSLPNLNWSKF